MSPSALGDYREAAATLSPPAVSQFLAAHDWELEARQDHVREVWRLAGPNGNIEGRIMLPLAQDFADFQRRFEDTLVSLGHIHSMDAVELYEGILATRADLFFVRLDQAMLDGTIPFQQAEKTLQALYKMVRAAATTAADPSHSHRGRRPAGVAEFLEDDVRLGHTKRGSFVFTIVTRLGDPSPVLPDQVDPITPFPRRVMETLARGLETAERMTRHWDEQVLEEPGRSGLSAGLVESLEDMAQPVQLRQVDLSFEWAAASADLAKVIGRPRTSTASRGPTIPVPWGLNQLGPRLRPCSEEKRKNHDGDKCSHIGRHSPRSATKGCHLQDPPDRDHAILSEDGTTVDIILNSRWRVSPSRY
ncbi:hypothetical protein [Streptomyces yanii]|uniref:hypothetical protein n=1 Tax=Streptomyces yanii TaxID=78510 RepID=UPI0031E6F87C